MSASTMDAGASQRTVGQVSVVVPVRDEVRSLGALIASIENQTRAPDEIVIVDAGSVDGTLELARELARRDPRIRVIAAGVATPGRARNVGIANSRNDWVALTDAGTEASPDWLEQLESAANACPQCDVVYGHYEPVIRSRFDECAALTYVLPKRPSPAGPIRAPSVVSCLVTRRAWDAAGGFLDLRAGEDTVFLQGLQRVGAGAAWAPRATVHWHMQPTLGQTFQRFRVFSYHGVKAGRQRNWHHGVARIYLGAGMVVLAARLGDGRVALLIPAAGLLRVAGVILARRDGRPLRWALAPRRLAGVATILATTDLALFVGWAQGLLRVDR